MTNIITNPFAQNIENLEDILSPNTLTKESGIRLRLQAQRDPENTTELSIGQSYLPQILNDYELADTYVEAMKLGLLEKYGPVSGLQIFNETTKRRVADLFGEEYLNAGVIPQNGSQQACLTLAFGLVDPKKGEEVLFFTPNFPNASKSFELVGAKVNYVQAAEENGFNPSGAQILEQFNNNPNLKVCVLTSPSNPAGGATTEKLAREQAEAINQIVKNNKNALFVLDYAYEGMEPEEASNITKFLSAEAKQKTVVTFTSSKKHATANARLGWIIGHPSIIARFDGIMATTTNNVQGLAQYQTAKAMEKLENFPAIEEAIAYEHTYRVSYMHKILEDIKEKCGVQKGDDSNKLSGGLFEFNTTPLKGLKVPEAIRNETSPVNKSKVVGSDGVVVTSSDVADVMAFAGNIKVEGLNKQPKDLVIVEGDIFNMTKDKDGIGNPNSYVRIACNREPTVLAEAALAIWVVTEQAKAEEKGLKSIPAEKVAEMNKWMDAQKELEADRTKDIYIKQIKNCEIPEVKDFLLRVYDSRYREHQRNDVGRIALTSFGNKTSFLSR